MLTNNHLKAFIFHVSWIIWLGSFLLVFLWSLYQIIKIINAPITTGLDNFNLNLLQFFSLSQTFNDVIIILVFCIILTSIFSVLSLNYIKIYNFWANISHKYLKKGILFMIIFLPFISFWFNIWSFNNWWLIFISFYAFHWWILLLRNSNFFKSTATENNYINAWILFFIYILLITFTIWEDYTFNYLWETKGWKKVNILYMNDKYAITKDNWVYPLSEIVNFK